MLSRFFIFDIDPDSEDLEAEKALVQEESRKARIISTQKMVDDEERHREREKVKGIE